MNETAASAEAADAANAIWPKLAEVPPLLRCSGCELTLVALHARAVTAARRLSPPSWTVTAEETKNALVHDSWNGACGALASDAQLRVVDGAFFAGDAFITRVWEEVTETVLSESAKGTRANGTETSADATNVSDANSMGSPPPPQPPSPSYSFPEGFEGVDLDAFNVTRAAISVCALLRHDARAKAHLTSVVVSGGVYPFAREVIAAQCALITADASCEGWENTRDEL